MKRISAPWYVVFYAVVLYFSTVLNQQILTHFYTILSHSEGVGSLFSLTPPLVLFSALSIVFLFFSSKYIFKGAMIFLIVTGAQVGYFATKYGIIFDYDMMVNIFSTNFAEARGYISLESILAAFIYGVLPAIFLCYIKIKWPQSLFKAIWQRLLVFVIAAITLVAIAIPYYQNYASIGRNNSILRKEISPYNYVYYGYKALKQMYFPTVVKFDEFGKKSFIDNSWERPELFVVVVGETARAQNFKHNGYERNTTPYTDKFENLIKFAPVQSCGTATAVSVPCMFSRQNREEYDEVKAQNSSNLTDLLKYAGYDVYWYDNDGGCKGVCKRINNVLISNSDPKLKGKCGADGCYDEVLLPLLKERLQLQTQNKKSSVIFLHIIGSHGPTYFARVPEDKKVFFPTCERGDIENCSREEIVNAYDNTLVYTDYILSEVIKSLEPYQQNFGTGVFYISDHGESLGEMGLYLHGAPYALAPDEQKFVPMMTYFSNSFVEDHKMDMNCLANEAKLSFSQDNFFHSLLGILDVNTSFYNGDQDLFLKCRIWDKLPPRD